MRTRIIQDQPEPQDPPEGVEQIPESNGLTSRLARWSASHRKTAILGWVVIVLALFGVMSSEVIKTENLTTAESTAGNAGDAEEILDDAGLRPTEELILIQSQDLTNDDPEFQAVIDETAAALASTAHVVNVAPPSEAPVSEDGHSAFVEFEVKGGKENLSTNLEASAATTDDLKAAHADFQIDQFGDGSAEEAIDEVVQGDIGKAGAISLPITLIILLIALGALVAASVPFVLALTTVLATMGIVAIPSQVFPLDGNANALILLIGLAVTVDYALFYMRREREERAKGRSVSDSIAAAAATSGRAVLISGLTVIIAMAGMFLTGDATFISFAVATVSVVIVALVASLAVLPAVLAWLGDRVEKGRVPFTRGMRRTTGESRFWSGVVTGATRRPLLAIALAGGLLVALAIPGLGMKVVQSGTEDLPQNLEVIQVYDRYKEAFPSEVNGVEVAVKADDVTTGPTAAAIDELVSGAEASSTLLNGTEVTVSNDHTVASVSIPSRGNGTDDESIAALDEVREGLIPATVGAVDGAEVKVTGAAARTSDFSDLLADRMPLVFAFVLGFAFVLMLVTFRSIVIPLKAIVLNLLSVGAAYGVLVLVFQNGWGESLLGFESNGGVTNWLPVFLFVILFGLSMDYHVFILTRVRELYDRGMSTEEAVRRGIAGSASTVTTAAVVMVLVFSVFATLSFLDFKEMGVGLAVAILIDATIIRGVLLPASMTLLGERNWWLPSWLGWLPRMDDERSTDVPASADTKPASA